MRTISIYLDTHSLFECILTLLKPNVILDIGSRDGKESLRFKRLHPESCVVAYEANPHQFRKMMLDFELTRSVEIRNEAVTSAIGDATFFIVRADYDKEEVLNNNLGQSSLLADGLHIQEAVKVCTTTVDFELARLLNHADEKCALWIDVEGAEAKVFEGCVDQRNNVQLIHVECASRPRRSGQKSMYELQKMLHETHVMIGHTSTLWRGWGDAVFVHRDIAIRHRLAILDFKKKAHWLWIRHIARRLLVRLNLKQ